MSGGDFIISLPRKCVGKKASSRLTLFDKSPETLEWFSPDARISPPNLLNFSFVLDPLYRLRPQFSDVMWTSESLLVSTNDIAAVYLHYEPYETCDIPLNKQSVSTPAGSSRLNHAQLSPEFQKILGDLVDFANVAITVSANYVLSIFGSVKCVAFARYQLFVILNHTYGYAVSRMELAKSRQPLVAGQYRHNLLTLFQQTGVNVYMPPILDCPADADVDEVYLAGDKVQVVIAEKLLQDVVVQKTDSLEKECVISVFVRDVLSMHYRAELETIMLDHATFVQFPPMGQSQQHIVRVMGATRRSINNTIDDLMKLCGQVYVVELKAHLEQSLAAALAALGVNIRFTATGTVFYGTREHCHDSLNTLRHAGTDSLDVCVLIEQPLELMEFILGKKQGKIMKVVNDSETNVSVEKFNEHNFRLRMTGQRITNIAEALSLLEAELPAERSLYIPEIYHKQIIGQGGQSVQQIMRKYNVYMRFVNATKEKYPNAFGDSRPDNVVIRCPSKNKAQIDSAVAELLQVVANLARTHHTGHVVLTRNHRRLLLANKSNALRDTEVSSGAAIKLPQQESRETQIVEISSQSQLAINNALSMLKQLLVHSDYEFRIPWTPRFAELVGPTTLFGEQVVAPLFVAMGAHVQAFEKVQMFGDNSDYSQIVVSVNESVDGDAFADISQVITAYLRKNNLDIVDQGKLSAEIQVQDMLQESSSLYSSLVLPSPSSSTNATRPSASHAMYTSPELPGATFDSSAFDALISVVSMRQDAKITVPKHTPCDLPPRPSATHSDADMLRAHTFGRNSFHRDTFCNDMLSENDLARAPMSDLQWNRNFEETPVKKRVPDGDTRRTDSRGTAATRMHMTHYLRRN